MQRSGGVITRQTQRQPSPDCESASASPQPVLLDPIMVLVDHDGIRMRGIEGYPSPDGAIAVVQAVAVPPRLIHGASAIAC